MHIYIRCRAWFAFYVDFSRAYGCKPFLQRWACNHEMIIDMPYCQIVMTGRRRLKQEEKKTGLVFKGEKKRRDISKLATGVAKD